MLNDNGVVTSPTLLQELANPDNNEAAWRTFLVRYQPLIYRWCCRWGLAPDQAEEITAAVLAKLVTALRTTFVYDPAHRFRGWLRAVVDNEVRSFWRGVGRRPGDRGSGDPAVHRRLDQVEAPGDVGGLVQELDEALARDLQLAQEVTARVRARVKEQTWQAFWHTAIAREPASDVAGRLGMTVAAVYMAKKRVSQLLHEEGVRVRGRGEGG